MCTLSSEGERVRVCSLRTYVYIGSVMVCGGVGVGGAGCTVVSRSPPHSVTTIQQLSDMDNI